MAGNFSVFERVNHKIRKVFVPVMAKHNRKKLTNTDFTIISNNCWGGLCYEYFGLPKNSPTVGTYIYAEDYVKLIKNLNYYMSCQINMISADEAKHKNDLMEANHMDVPIGVLDDVEIVFLHYRDPDLAKEKWTRRVERINWDNIIIKFSYMSKCSDDCIKEFQKINGVKKFCFVPKKFENMSDLIIVPSRIDSTSDLGDDTFYWNKYIDVFKLINLPTTGIRQMKIK